jgi:cation transport ATPase
MADDLAHLPFAVGLSRHTRGIIRQNVFVSLGVVGFLVPATILGSASDPRWRCTRIDLAGRRQRLEAASLPRSDR